MRIISSIGVISFHFFPLTAPSFTDLAAFGLRVDNSIDLSLRPFISIPFPHLFGHLRRASLCHVSFQSLLIQLFGTQLPKQR